MSKLYINTEENFIFNWIAEGYSEEEAEKKFQDMKDNFVSGLDRSFYMDANGQVMTTSDFVQAFEANYGVTMIAISLE